jgi:hypothetical protein
LLVFARGAFACQCEEHSPAKIYSEAEAIFVGQITEAYRIKDWGPLDLIRGKFDTIESLKGNPDSIPYVEIRAFKGLMCILSLKPGLKYLFVVYQDNSISFCTSVMVEHFPAQQWLNEFREIRDSLK